MTMDEPPVSIWDERNRSYDCVLEALRRERAKVQNTIDIVEAIRDGAVFIDVSRAPTIAAAMFSRGR